MSSKSKDIMLDTSCIYRSNSTEGYTAILKKWKGKVNRAYYFGIICTLFPKYIHMYFNLTHTYMCIYIYIDFITVTSFKWPVNVLHSPLLQTSSCTAKIVFGVLYTKSWRYVSLTCSTHPFFHHSWRYGSKMRGNSVFLTYSRTPTWVNGLTSIQNAGVFYHGPIFQVSQKTWEINL